VPEGSECDVGQSSHVCPPTLTFDSRETIHNRTYVRTKVRHDDDPAIGGPSKIAL
jgi:hypothetical protein